MGFPSAIHPAARDSGLDMSRLHVAQKLRVPSTEPARLRSAPEGLAAGARGTRIQGPGEALGLVAGELANSEQVLRSLLMSDVQEIPQVTRYLLDAGGKRLRPAIAALGARAIGHEPRPTFMCVGELVHLGSLFHDDVVDGGEERRDQPAAHKVYGNAAAVLGGDFCIARAMRLSFEEGGPRAAEELSRTLTMMAEGEMLQLVRAADLSLSREAYFEVIERKAAVLIAWCTASHAWREGCEEAAESLARYGLLVGMAFQIMDDVLDYADDTGKTPGIDLSERKVTLPLLDAMDRIPSLRGRLEQAAPNPSEVEALREEVRASGALDASVDHARGFVAQAHEALEGVPDGEGRDALEVLGHYVVDRVR